MAEKASKPKAKARREPPSVLATLPTTRPERLGKPRAKRKPPAATPPREPGPRAVRPACTPLRPGNRADPPPEGLGVPTGTELVTTTVRAAGELARIGVSLGARTLKGALRRLPRP